MNRLYPIAFLLLSSLIGCQEVKDKAIESRNDTIKIPTVENAKHKKITHSTAREIHAGDSLK